MADQKKIQEIKKKYEQQWLSIQDVVGVGIGILDDKNMGIIVSVVKLESQVASKIPNEIEGVKIEIRETGEFKAL
jgi:hypothetical protein